MKILLFLVVLGVIGIAALFWAREQIYRVSVVGSEQAFTIAPGASAQIVADNLAQKNLIGAPWAMAYYLWAQDLRGAIKAGEYVVSAGMTVPDIATMITTGKSVRRDVRVTFPEGTMLVEMAAILTKSGFDGAQFLTVTQKPSVELVAQFPFLRELPAGAPLEGYLFPDTYFFLPEATAVEIAHKMLATFDKKVTPILPTRNATAQKYDLHQLLTMASIVEGEVHKDGERAIVAGIFFNRLDIGMTLGSDATLDYIFGESKVKHSLAETKVVSPYNTYQLAGLPPGPINSPGLKAIAATFASAQTDYLYFLNNATTGETVFGTTFDEHIRNKNNNGL